VLTYIKGIIQGDKFTPTLRLVRRLCIIALLASTASVGLSAATKPQKKHTVVVVSLDGFPAYALDDPRLPIPTLRKLAREGVIAASMRPINPTVTWPNHTAIVTGVNASEHQVLFNGLLTRSTDGSKPTIEPWRDKEELVHTPTIYDLAFNAGLTTAQVDWVAIYGAKSITWQFPELPDPNGKIEHELIDAEIVTADQLKTFEDSSQAWQDEIWTAAAVDILQKYKPNLLLFHLLTLDDINHTYGSMSPASFTAMAFLDAKVKQIVDVIDRSGRAKNTTLIIVSDHGFRTYTNKIRPNVLLKEKGLLTGPPEHLSGDAWVMTEGGVAGVYVTNPERRAELLPELRRIFSDIEGIEKIYGTDEFAEIGFPLPSGGNQTPDLVLAAKPDYMFGGESDGEFITHVPDAGTHGYINTDPKMQAIFIARGAGIPKGVRIDSISNLDVAPTIAALLGVRMDHVSGHAIREIVASPK